MGSFPSAWLTDPRVPTDCSPGSISHLAFSQLNNCPWSWSWHGLLSLPHPVSKQASLSPRLRQGSFPTREERLTTAPFPLCLSPRLWLCPPPLFFNTSFCCYRLEKKNLTQVWIPPRLSHSLYHTSALLEEKRKAYLVIIFSSLHCIFVRKSVLLLKAWFDRHCCSV